MFFLLLLTSLESLIWLESLLLPPRRPYSAVEVLSATGVSNVSESLMLLTSLLLLTLNSLVLLVSLLWLTYFLLVVFPSVLAPLLLASLVVPVVSCVAVVSPDAAVLSSFNVPEALPVAGVTTLVYLMLWASLLLLEFLQLLTCLLLPWCLNWVLVPLLLLAFVLLLAFFCFWGMINKKQRNCDGQEGRAASRFAS